ncbi:MAG: hypothetical protein JXR96_06765 [Deltaproteobacteria bacterium]|nr:hypothetical protein [Deltaproteobacteria bacterium]
MKIRMLLGPVLLGLLALACVDYGNHRDDACQGVVCDSPPAPTCIDSRTVRRYESPGTCTAGECSYGFEDLTCPEGECAVGVCQGCTPACGDRQCGPDPRCGQSCGVCLDCEGVPDPSLCMDGICAPVCCPDCSGRECGPDGCGDVCGSCGPGCSCNPAGRCECECVYPVYPSDCRQVGLFQDGFVAYCDGRDIHVSWYEHVACNGQEEVVEFSCTTTCPHGCEQGAPIAWPEDGQQLVDDNCLGGDPCEGILLDNQGPPGIYPFLLFEPDGAPESYRQELAAFLSAFNVSSADYEAEAHPVTWTPDVQRVYGSGAWITVYDTELSEDSIEAAASGFIQSFAPFFGAEDAILQLRRSSCFSSDCRVFFDQSYCGLKVVSPEPGHDGSFAFIAQRQSAGLQRAASSLIPMLPIYANPYIGQPEAAAGLMGMTLEYWCADGPHDAVISEQSDFAFSPDPVVFVQYAPTGLLALEYRLAYELTVAVESFLSWTAYVDAFDGSLLKIDPDFICD